MLKTSAFEDSETSEDVDLVEELEILTDTLYIQVRSFCIQYLIFLAPCNFICCLFFH